MSAIWVIAGHAGSREYAKVSYTPLHVLRPDPVEGRRKDALNGHIITAEDVE